MTSAIKMVWSKFNGKKDIKFLKLKRVDLRKLIAV